MDPLSDVLSLMRPRSYMFRGIDVAGDWSVSFPSSGGIRCYAVLSGACWLDVDGMEGPIQLEAGDCLLLTSRQSSRLSSDVSLTPVDVGTFFSSVPEGGMVCVNGGGEVSGIGGFFEFAGDHANVLLALLPPIVHIRKESDRTKLRWSMEILMAELREPQPGVSLIAQHLGHIMLVLALRLHLSLGQRVGPGWLYALADRQLGTALAAIHSDPARRWTLQILADLAFMSRSVFATKFKETIGETPMEYLTRWRMMLAGDKLLSTGDSITNIANSLGYDSDSAFSAAFRRVMGCSPRQYKRPAEFESRASLAPGSLEGLTT